MGKQSKTQDNVNDASVEIQDQMIQIHTMFQTFQLNSAEYRPH